MAKYYVPFVNINTFIYEPCGLEENIYAPIGSVAIQKFKNSKDFLNTPKAIDSEGNEKPVLAASWAQTYIMAQNTIGSTSGNEPSSSIISPLSKFKNKDFSSELPTTASFFTALNLKRNGPYGYSSWRQIRSHEDPLIRNQKKKNIFTVMAQDGDISTYNQPNGPGTPYVDPRTIEVFKEPVFSSREKNLVINFPQGNKIYRASLEMGSKIKYFDNDRLNEIYSPYDLSNPIETDSRFKAKFIEKTFLMIGRRRPISIEYTHTILPQKSSLEYDKRVRTNFYHPWKDDRQKRKRFFQLNGGTGMQVDVYTAQAGTQTFETRYSRWPLDPIRSFLANTDDKIGFLNLAISTEARGHPGKLMNMDNYLVDLQTKNRSYGFLGKIFPTPRFSNPHFITPLTSCVGPHGMDIEGVNNGTLFNDLSIDHIPSGEANWDAGSQYGTNPFYDSYEEFVYDIKKVGKDYTFIPEFRSSLYFGDLQNNQTVTPKGFLEVFGGRVDKTSTDATASFFIGSKNGLDTTEIGPVSASSEDPGFYNTYSHSDFMKNFDIVSEIANTSNKPLFKMSLTCKAIKKFAPYEGFYPGERTIQIAEKFRDSIIDNCAYTGSGADNNVGDILTTDEDRYIYFNNIMAPMFAPGIMFNSIKSGLAIDYPIHTSSLTIENGGVREYNNNFYIQKPFDERIPFEALLEPNVYLANKEIHCSEPHPSGNLSGSATWNGTGDTTEYQLMMHNFLAETANFFLQDQNFSFISSGRSDELNINLESGSIAALDIALYKSQNRASKTFQYGASGTNWNSFFMTGSGVQETFTMYSRPSAFGPPNIITSSAGASHYTASYSYLGYNWPFTPSYYDGISKISMLFSPTETRNFTVSEIFEKSVFIENRYSELEGLEQSDATSIYAGMAALNKNLQVHRLPINIAESTLISQGHELSPNEMSHASASLNISLGMIKDVDLLDDDTSDTVKVAVDISSDRKSQIIIQPKWETPMFNFQGYSDSGSLSLPLVGSQSAPRGIWHQYGAIETDPSKGVFMQIANPRSNFMLVSTAESQNRRLVDLAKMMQFSTAPVKLGKTASKKVVREAIVAVPFYDYTPNARRVSGQRKFLNIPRGVIDDALDGNGKENVLDMVNKMQRFVMPPMFNFIEDEQLDPVTMYVFDFKHTFDQEDLAAIWQNLPPKLMTQFETEEKTISHSFEMDDLMSADALEQAGQGDMNKILKNLRWMVFKVKQKAEQNYYDKIVGETQELNKTSPYSHNWPYDYFSLVELAKIDTKVQFATPPPPPEVTLEPLPVVTVPSLGPVVVPPAPTPVPRRSRKTLVEKPVPTPKIKENKPSPTPPKKKVVPATRESMVVAPKVGPKRETALQPISSPPRPERSERAKKQAGKDNLKKDEKQQGRDEKDQKTTMPDVSGGRKR